MSHGQRGHGMPVDLASVDLPHEPGVYLFKTNQGRVLYVGKATRLNERIRSYFASNPDRHMIPELVARADDIECIVTQTPQAALVLERQLIREHLPRFNSMLKDGKSFPYLALTNEEYPRIMYTRNPPKSSQQWGLFPMQVLQNKSCNCCVANLAFATARSCSLRGAFPCTSACALGHASTVQDTMNGSRWLVGCSTVMQHRCSRNSFRVWRRHQLNKHTKSQRNTAT